VWVAFAAARHIRRHEARVGSAPAEGTAPAGELAGDIEDLVPAEKT